MYRKTNLCVFLFHCVLYVVSSSSDTCGAPFTGTFFEDFHGSHSYQKYEIFQNYLNENSLTYQVRFRTTRIDGIIAQFTSNINEEEILLEIIDGTFGIQLIRDVNPKPEECLFQLDYKVNDGQCYLVTTLATKTKLTVELFRQRAKVSSTEFKLNECIVGNFSTFLRLEKGGVEHTYLARHKVSPRLLLGKPHLLGNFEGCMGDALVNGVPLVESAKKDASVDVDPSCHHKFSSTCTNICPTSYIADGNGNCRCPDDNKINAVGLCKPSCDCIADKCQNGGSCEVLSEDKLACRCPPGYKGRWCEEKENPCRDVVCQNGGTCNNTAEPLCTCTPEFIGNRCEIRIDPCISAPCKNNAVCNVTGELYSCICSDGYFGQFCENQSSNDDNEISFWMLHMVTPVALIVVIALSMASVWIIRRRIIRRRIINREQDSAEQSTGSE